MKANNKNYNTTNFTQLHSQVNDVTGIMKQNVEKVLNRGDKLDDLVDKTTELESTVSDHRNR